MSKVSGLTAFPSFVLSIKNLSELFAFFSFNILWILFSFSFLEIYLITIFPIFLQIFVDTQSFFWKKIPLILPYSFFFRLEMLDVSNCSLSTITVPDGCFPIITYLDLSENNFTVVPSFVKNLTVVSDIIMFV